MMLTPYRLPQAASKPQCLLNTPRTFTTSSSLLKKGGKANKAHARSDSSPPVTDLSGSTPTDEAYDMSGLESQTLKAIERLTHDLSQLRSGGRLNPDVVESLKVSLGTAREGKETVRLGDIAQVVPKGRVLHVMCGEQEVPYPWSQRHQTPRYDVANIPSSMSSQ
jgi:ribosome recycling factor